MSHTSDELAKIRVRLDRIEQALLETAEQIRAIVPNISPHGDDQGPDDATADVSGPAQP